MVILVHVVKGRQHIVRTFDAAFAEMESETDSQPWKLQIYASITEMNITARYSFQSSDRWVVDGVLYIAHASYRDCVNQEVQPAILVR